MTKAEHKKAYIAARSATARQVIAGKRKIRHEYVRIFAKIAGIVRANRFKPFLEEQIRAAFPRKELYDWLMKLILNGRANTARLIADIEKKYIFDALDKVPGHGLSKDKITAMFEAKIARTKIANSKPYTDVVKNEREKKYTGEKIYTKERKYTGTGFAYRPEGKWKDTRIDYTFRQSFSLGKSVWDTVNHTEDTILDVVLDSISKGRDVRTVAADLMEYVHGGPQALLGRWGKYEPAKYVADIGPRGGKKWDRVPKGADLRTKEWRGKVTLTPDQRAYRARFGKVGVDYRAMRLYRSEKYRNLQEAAVEDGESNPGCTGEYDWVLMPGRGTWNCECPDVAAAGPYTVAGGIPEYQHPNCDCMVEPRMKDHDEFIQQLRDYVKGEDTPGAREIEEWARENDLRDEPQFMSQPAGDINEYPMNREDTEEDRTFRQELTQQFSERGIKVDFDTTPKETLDYIVNLYDKVQTDFPNIGETLNGIYCSYSPQTLSINEAAAYQYDKNIILYNQRIFASKKNLLKYLTKHEGQFASTKISSALAHEFGHAIENLLIKISKKDDIIKTEICNLFKKNNVTWGKVEKGLSLYAYDEEYHDTIAEAVSEYLTEGNDCRNMAKGIYNMLLLLYRGMK